jgi:hypothetical protein
MGTAASKKKKSVPQTPSRLAPTTDTSNTSRPGSGAGTSNRSRPASGTTSTTNTDKARSRDRSPSVLPVKAKDLMISYSHADKDFMNKLKGKQNLACICKCELKFKGERNPTSLIMRFSLY